jgi:hypothetical protein
MKYTFRNFTLFFFYTFALVLFFSGACAANYVLIPAQAPAIITAPDYVDSFQAPSPSGLPGQVFRSKEGFLFSFDGSGRRVYHMHASYVLSAHGSRVPVHYVAAPMIAVHPAAVRTTIPWTFAPQHYYVLVP